MKRKRVRQSDLSSPQSTPQENAEAYRSMLDAHEFARLLQEVEQPLLPALRINPLKAPADLPQRLAEKYGWRIESIPFCSQGFRVDCRGGIEVSAALEHRLGMYYIQEAASMLPAELFTFTAETSPLVLDMAASPGGKTTHLISRLGETGLVIANDASQGRIQALRIVLQQWGAVNVGITHFPGERFGDWYNGVFDKVLLDAPCSMQGLRTADSHPVRPVTAKESQQLSRRQRSLLASAIRALRVGGEVVYSTCTLLPRENELVIDAALHDFAGSIELMDAQQALPEAAPGLTTMDGVALHPGMEKTIRLWPHRFQTAGFFVSLLRKTAEVENSASSAPYHPMEDAGFRQLTAAGERDFCDAFLVAFGFDLSKSLTHYRLVLVQRHEKIYLFPAMLIERFHGLPLSSAGLLLGEETPDGFLPSHEWTSRFGSQCTKNIIQLDDEDSAAWMSGADISNRAAIEQTSGSFRLLLNPERYPLGRAKVTAGVLKNLLPRRLV